MMTDKHHKHWMSDEREVFLVAMQKNAWSMLPPQSAAVWLCIVSQLFLA